MRLHFEVQSIKFITVVGRARRESAHYTDQTKCTRKLKNGYLVYIYTGLVNRHMYCTYHSQDTWEFRGRAYVT